MEAALRLLEFRARSRQELVQRLQRKGAAPSLIDAVLEEAADPAQEAAAAEGQVRQRLRLLRRLEPAAQRRRLYGFLQRRGYAADVIERALARVVSDDGD